jgi:hypothetical protein
LTISAVITHSAHPAGPKSGESGQKHRSWHSPDPGTRSTACFRKVSPKVKDQACRELLAVNRCCGRGKHIDNDDVETPGQETLRQSAGVLGGGGLLE